MTGRRSEELASYLRIGERRIEAGGLNKMMGPN
jgi:hypothetical protein